MRFSGRENRVCPKRLRNANGLAIPITWRDGTAALFGLTATGGEESERVRMRRLSTLEDSMSCDRHRVLRLASSSIVCRRVGAGSGSGRTRLSSRTQKRLEPVGDPQSYSLLAISQEDSISSHEPGLEDRPWR